MRNPRRRPPLPPAQAPDSFDKMCWEVCAFGNGGRSAKIPGACQCADRRVAACDSVRPTVNSILAILTSYGDGPGEDR